MQIKVFSYFNILLITCVVSVLGLIYYKIQIESSSQIAVSNQSPLNNPIQTNNWKTMKTKYWSFKIPNDWTVADCDDGNFLFLGPGLQQGQKIQCEEEYPLPDPRFIVTRQVGFDYPYRNDPGLRVEEEVYKIGGLDAIKQKVYGKNFEVSTKENEYFVKHEGALIRISLLGLRSTKEEFEAFVSSFNFNQ